MTEQEVIKEFEERLAIADYRDNIPKYYKAMELAIKDMKEIQKYRAIGTPDKIKEELDHLRNDNDCQGLYFTLEERQDLARQHRELEEYRAIGTVEELQKAEKEEDILKFYYCDSEDSYLVGLRIGNFYYAHYIDGRWVFDMSRHLPWGEHVVDDTTEWKEHTYPSEPKEINFSEWLNGFIKKECGGTPEECRAAVDKQKAKAPIRNDKCTCPSCGTYNEVIKKRRNTVYSDIVYCWHCGQSLEIFRSDEE